MVRLVISTRSAAALFTVLGLLSASACGSAPSTATDQQRATQAARAYLEPTVGTGGLDRATVEVRPSAVGWLVVFRDVNLPCAQVHWPEACGMAAPLGPTPTPYVYRDLFACVEVATWRVGRAGGGPQPLDDEDHCVR